MSPIVTEHETKSISQEVTFSKDVRQDKALEETLREQSGEVARQLRKNNLACRTIKLKIRWPDSTTLTRQTTLSDPTDQEETIARVALDLLRVVRKPSQPVRLIGVGVTGLGPPVRQLGLWDTNLERERKMQEILDELQEKYGDRVIRRGNRS